MNYDLDLTDDPCDAARQQEPDDGRCPERCLGVVGHAGPCQPRDYVPPSVILADDPIVRAALVVLREDARDPKRDAMWRYGVRHALAIIERALGPGSSA